MVNWSQPLFDNGARVNTVMPAFVKKHGWVLALSPTSTNTEVRFQFSCSGGYNTEPIGYVMVWVQFPRIPLYDENQVALVIRDGSEFSRRVPVIKGTPTIDRVVRALKESELDTIPGRMAEGPVWTQVRKWLLCQVHEPD